MDINDENFLSAQKIVPVKIEDEMKRSYIDYAMSVIVSRALPDVRDGLKPVHRRILYAMNDLALWPDKPYRKSASIVGETMGNYHPHGDAAIYDALVRLSQDFSLRYPLVDGHGNFGSIDNDPPAAMRYTEAKLHKIALEMLADLDKDTVDFVPNYDDRLKEPSVLPAKLPYLLINGAYGIAVGMASNIPPHNLTEVVNGIVAQLDNPDITNEELMQYIKGPDFPTAGVIVGKEGIKEAYTTGRGKVCLRAKAEIEEDSRGRYKIIVTEIPYQVNKAALIQNIAKLVQVKTIEGISDLRDESDREGVRIVIELKRDANPNVVLNMLYKHTQLQNTQSMLMLAIVNGVPKVLTLREILAEYIKHREQVVVRRTKFDLNKAEARLHILEGLRIAIDHIDEIIKIIRNSYDNAAQNLMERFGLSEIQAQAILEMKLRTLQGLQREKIEQEYNELVALIKHLKDILASEQLVKDIIKEEVIELKNKYGDERRTSITHGVGDIDVESLIKEETNVVTLTHFGYIKRIAADVYRSQRRGGKGLTAMNTREEDFVEHLFITSTHNSLMFFTNTGKVFRLKTYELPEASRTAKGTAIVNLLQLSQGEKIAAVMPAPEPPTAITSVSIVRPNPCNIKPLLSLRCLHRPAFRRNQYPHTGAPDRTPLCRIPFCNPPSPDLRLSLRPRQTLRRSPRASRCTDVLHDIPTAFSPYFRFCSASQRMPPSVPPARRILQRRNRKTHRRASGLPEASAPCRYSRAPAPRRHPCSNIFHTPAAHVCSIRYTTGSSGSPYVLPANISENADPSGQERLPTRRKPDSFLHPVDFHLPVCATPYGGLFVRHSVSHRR